MPRKPLNAKPTIRSLLQRRTSKRVVTLRRQHLKLISGQPSRNNLLVSASLQHSISVHQMLIDELERNICLYMYTCETGHTVLDFIENLRGNRDDLIQRLIRHPV